MAVVYRSWKYFILQSTSCQESPNRSLVTKTPASLNYSRRLARPAGSTTRIRDRLDPAAVATRAMLFLDTQA